MSIEQHEYHLHWKSGARTGTCELPPVEPGQTVELFGANGIINMFNVDCDGSDKFTAVIKDDVVVMENPFSYSGLNVTSQKVRIFLENKGRQIFMRRAPQNKLEGDSMTGGGLLQLIPENFDGDVNRLVGANINTLQPDRFVQRWSLMVGMFNFPFFVTHDGKVFSSKGIDKIKLFWTNCIPISSEEVDRFIENEQERERERFKRDDPPKEACVNAEPVTVSGMGNAPVNIDSLEFLEPEPVRRRKRSVRIPLRLRKSEPRKRTKIDE